MRESGHWKKLRGLALINGLYAPLRRALGLPTVALSQVLPRTKSSWTASRALPLRPSDRQPRAQRSFHRGDGVTMMRI